MKEKDKMDTPTKIEQAFLEIYVNKPIEKIGIKEITIAAKVNRSTFYNYYLDIYDLKEKVENHIFDEISHLISQVMNEYLSGVRNKHGEKVEEFYGQRQGLVTMFFKGKFSPQLVERIKENNKKIIRQAHGLPEKEESPEIDLILEYTTSAMIATVSYWLLNNKKIDGDQLLDLMYDLNDNGPLQALRKYNK